MIIAPDLRVFLAPGTTDLRKSINGLSALVKEELRLDLFTSYLFGFCNKRRDLIKLLYWDRNGFALWMKWTPLSRHESGQNKIESTLI